MEPYSNVPQGVWLLASAQIIVEVKDAGVMHVCLRPVEQ